MLGLLAILGNSPLEHRAFAHASLLLAVAWCVYLYRDVWPLATFTESPADLGEGSILWVKIALLFLGGVVIPLLAPRKYPPLDAKVRVVLVLRGVVADHDVTERATRTRARADCVYTVVPFVQFRGVVRLEGVANSAP